MQDSQNIPWKRIATEAAAIVGSILLAFAIDAWWQERLERKEEAEQLSRLHAEFLVNVDRLEGYRAPLAGGQQATQEVFEIIQAAQANGQASVDFSSLLLREMIYAPTFEADTPVLDGLIRSGGQEIIENRKLIGSLARWESGVRNYTELAQRTRRNTDLQLVPALSVRGDFGPALMRTFDPFPPENIDLDPTHLTKIDVDDEFKMLVASRYQNGEISFGNLLQLREKAKAVIEAIEAAQAD